MAEDVLDIGEVIEATGLPASTLHLWEREGLIETCGRQGLRRQYRPDVIERIAMIVVLKFSGFTLAEIGDLLDPHAFDHDKTLLQSKLDQLRAHRARLDRAIEGIEHGAHAFCLGVQWHPEFFISEGDRRIFNAFVKAAT